MYLFKRSNNYEAKLINEFLQLRDYLYESGAIADSSGVINNLEYMVDILLNSNASEGMKRTFKASFERHFNYLKKKLGLATSSDPKPIKNTSETLKTISDIIVDLAGEEKFDYVIAKLKKNVHFDKIDQIKLLVRFHNLIKDSNGYIYEQSENSTELHYKIYFPKRNFKISDIGFLKSNIDAFNKRNKNKSVLIKFGDNESIDDFSHLYITYIV